MSSEHPLLVRLQRVLDLSEAEAAAIQRVPFQRVAIKADEVIAREGDQPSRSCVVDEGIACTSKVVAGGKRQIMAFHIAGDMPDLHSLHLKLLDSDIWAITDCRLSYFPHQDLRQLCREQPRVTEELWKITLIEAAIHREWTVNVGQRQAPSRLAHLFCEMFLKSRVAGLTEGNSCPFGVTQSDLSEATALSAVHMNRTLQALREQGLVSFGKGRLTIHDWDTLVALADFRTDYLHLPELGAQAA